jgi:peptidoglycan/LPS O-acetylase OafA/YrhL
MKRIPSLDGLRALSITLVLLAHLAGTQHFFGMPAMAPLGDLGNLGVRTFFVISGFLITRLLLAELDRTRRISLKAFYIRRLLRIFPAFYVFIICASLLSLIGFAQLDRTDFLHAVTYTMNYHVPAESNFSLRHLWSLSVEEQFYFLWPLTLGVLGIRRSRWVLAGVIATVPFVRIVRYQMGPGSEALIGMAFETVCDALATGCLLATLLPSLLKSRWYVRVIASPLFPVLLVAVLIANRQTDHPNLFWIACIPFMNVVIALTISRYVQFPALFGGRVLNTTPLVAIGVASYSLYIWQQLFLIQFRAPVSIVHVFPLNVIAAGTCAALSYQVVEKPFLRLKRYFQSEAVEDRAAREEPSAPSPIGPIQEPV